MFICNIIFKKKLYLKIKNVVILLSEEIKNIYNKLV
jgi:hypothetical protein